MTYRINENRCEGWFQVELLHDDGTPALGKNGSPRTSQKFDAQPDGSGRRSAVAAARHHHRTGRFPSEDDADYVKPFDRAEKIMAHTRTFTGRRTKSGKPYVVDLRKATNIDDVSVAERDRAHADSLALEEVRRK